MNGMIEEHGNVLFPIVLATVMGGVASVFAASLVAFTMRAHWIRHLVSFAAGTMLAAALLNLLPEAVEGGLSIQDAGAMLLTGLLLFFLIEKCVLWRHWRAHGVNPVKPAGPMILVGDAFHNFTDGVVIAAAFLHDVKLGVTTTLAIVAHEIPQEVGDFMVLLNAGFSRRRALFYNALSSLAAVLGGVLGYYVLNEINAVVPYAIALAAAGFLYIAIANLMPELHRRHGVRAGVMQFALIALGIAMVPVAHGA